MSDHVELQSLVDSHELPFVAIGKRYQIVAVNRAFEETFGCERSIVGEPCYQVLHRRERPCNELGEPCPYLECLVTKQPCSRLHTHHDSRGEARWVRVNMYPIVGADGHTYVGESLREIAALDESLQSSELRPVGSSPAFLHTMEQLEQAARTDAPLLLTGETGTGKELAARFVHNHSRRSRHACVTVDCSVIAEPLFESEMFGHERGSFTGSVDSKQGLFELAHEGTIFLDEIGEVPLGMQAKLLRVLETGDFRRVGGNRMIRTNARVICATNRPLWKRVEAGEFRQDLFYRIACFCIRIPSLRERREDIPLLADALLRRIGRRDQRTYRLSDQAALLLLDYPYPGNVRELRNILQVAAGRLAPGDGDVIGPNVLEDALHMRPYAQDHVVGEAADPPPPPPPLRPATYGRGRPISISSTSRAGARKPLYAPSIEHVEVQHIAQLLHAHRGNRRQVAMALGISERTLYRKLAQYDLK
jgi:transcriptional regulator with PAS, ATPase and Fis domain